MNVELAREALRQGREIRMVVGDAPEDPTLILWLYDGMVMAESIAGWSEGVVEPVCALESDFLAAYLTARQSIALTTTDARSAYLRTENP